MDAGVAEIHRHPLRPMGFAEPLFLGRAHKKEIADHLARSGWLGKAGEGVPGAGGPEGTGEVCHVLARPDGGAHLVRSFAGRPGCRGGRRRVTRRRVSAVIERWREVRRWWEPNRAADRLCFRLRLSDGAVVDVALDRTGPRAGSWSLVRVVD